MDRFFQWLCKVRFLTWSIALHVLLAIGFASLIVTRASEAPPQLRPYVGDIAFLDERPETSGPPAFKDNDRPILEEIAEPKTELVTSVPASALTALVSSQAAESRLSVAQIGEISSGNQTEAATGRILARSHQLQGQTGLGGSGGSGFARFQFLGEEVIAKDIIFVVDISLSMAADEATKARCETVFREVERAIMNLPPTVSFNIIAFGSRVIDFRSQMVKASEREKMSARPWLRRHNPANAWSRGRPPNWYVERRGLHLATLVYEGVTEALESRPSTIILVCDGQPSQSQYDSQETIEALETLFTQPYCNVIMNTFSVAADEATQDFMKEMARVGRGNHRLFE